MTASPSQTENCGIAARYYAPPTFTSRDPLFEKYFWLSPYTYCANNPMKFVDPTGCEVKIPPFPTVNSVISKKDIVSWRTGGNCFVLAKEQMQKAGVTAQNIKYQLYKEPNKPNQSDFEAAVNYMKDNLLAGKPIMIGVDNQPGSPNSDGTTDHFVVIVGMGNDKKGNYFQFYDNAASLDNSNQGTSPDNKLYIDEKRNVIQGFSKTNYGNSYSDYDLGAREPYTKGYIISQVRETVNLGRNNSNE